MEISLNTRMAGAALVGVSLLAVGIMKATGVWKGTFIGLGAVLTLGSGCVGTSALHRRWTSGFVIQLNGSENNYIPIPPSVKTPAHSSIRTHSQALSASVRCGHTHDISL